MTDTPNPENENNPTEDLITQALDQITRNAALALFPDLSPTALQQAAKMSLANRTNFMPGDETNEDLLRRELEIEFDRRLGTAAEMAGQLWKMLIKAHHHNLIDHAIATKPPDHTNN